MRRAVLTQDFRTSYDEGASLPLLPPYSLPRRDVRFVDASARSQILWRFVPKIMMSDCAASVRWLSHAESLQAFQRYCRLHGAACHSGGERDHYPTRTARLGRLAGASRAHARCPLRAE